MTPHETNLALAKALNLPIGDPEHDERRPLLEEHAGNLLLHEPYDVNLWSPATDAGDALACLEAMQAKTNWAWIASQEGYELFLVNFVVGGKEVGDRMGKTFCEAACLAILAAEAAQ